MRWVQISALSLISEAMGRPFFSVSLSFPLLKKVRTLQTIHFSADLRDYYFCQRELVAVLTVINKACTGPAPDRLPTTRRLGHIRL